MSYNSLFGLGTHSVDTRLIRQFQLQDDAPSTVVAAQVGSNGTLAGAGNTSASSVTGPNNWLPKAIRFDGTNDEVTFADFPTELQSQQACTITAWAKSSSATAANRVIYGFGSNTASGRRSSFQAYQNFASVKARFSNSNVTITATSSPPNDGNWRFFTASRNSTTAQITEDGTVIASGTNTGTMFATFNYQTIGSDSGSNFFNGDIAQVTLWNAQLSSGDESEIRFGPEPLNTVAPTLTISTTAWTGTVGSADSQGNGTITYVWELRDADDDSVVESGTGSSPSGSGTYSGAYRLWVRYSNDGGYDTAEDSVSADETATGGSGAPAPATLTLETFAPTVLTPQTVTPTAAILTLATFAPSVTASSASTPTPTTAQLSLTTFAPSVTATANMIATPDPATLALSSFAPAVSVASGSVTVTPMTASLTLTTLAPSLAAEVPPVWTITFTGHQYCSGDLSVPKTKADLVISKTQGDLIVKD